MKTNLLLIFILILQLKINAQNCTYIQAIDTANNSITFTATDTASVFNYIFVLDTTSVLNNLTGGHSATYQGFLNDTLPHEICLKIVDLINQVVICELCTTFQLGGSVAPPPNPSCAFTYYFSNDTLYASQSGSATPANYVWTVNGNFYSGSQLVLYVGNIDSVQVNLNGQNLQLGTSCFNTLYAVNPNYVPPSPSCAFTYYFSNDTLYANQSGSATPADYVWTVNGNFYNGSQLVLYVGNIDSIQVNLNGQNLQLGTSCFNTLYAVNPFYVPVVAHCNTDFVNAANGLTNYFIDITSNNNPQQSVYYWTFGDGNSSNVRNVEHTYLLDGDYNVCLWVKDTLDSSHCNDTICKLITISNSSNVDTCSAYFVFTQIQAFSIGAINLASGVNPVFSWNFGDGPQSIISGPYPSYTYLNADTYEICLTVTTDSCTTTYCDSLTVDSAGIMRGGMQEGFTINVLSPAQVTGLIEAESILNNNISMKIYPNPSDGVFTISSSANIEVYNIVGDLILSDNNATSIDLTVAPKGMYFVRLNGGKIEKLIKN
jgi:hypothetical protein